MKNLANCKPSEFLKQTYKIKKSVEKWITDIDLMNIRKNMPVLPKVTKDMPEEEAERIRKENRNAMEKFAMNNFMQILDAAMDVHADETLAILALCCFVDPADVDNHPIEYYLDSFAEIMGNKSVIGFFTSLAQLAQMNTQNVSEE